MFSCRTSVASALGSITHPSLSVCRLLLREAPLPLSLVIERKILYIFSMPPEFVLRSILREQEFLVLPHYFVYYRLILNFIIRQLYL